jgi:hypothetical protein
MSDAAADEEADMAVSAMEPPARRRRIASLPPLQLCDFPVGCQVLTPRQNLDDGRHVSYFTVLSHKGGKLQVDIPGEQPFLLTLDYLRRTSEKHGEPMRKGQPALPASQPYDQSTTTAGHPSASALAPAFDASATIGDSETLARDTLHHRGRWRLEPGLTLDDDSSGEDDGHPLHTPILNGGAASSSATPLDENVRSTGWAA